MSETKRQQIRKKVAAGEARNKAREEATLAQRAAQMRDDALDLAREHPVLVVVGGLALGFAVSLMFKRSPTRQVSEKAAKKASGFAVLAAELAIPLIRSALSGAGEAGQKGLGRIEEFGEAAGEKARSAGQAAAERASSAGQRIARAVRSRAH